MMKLQGSTWRRRGRPAGTEAGAGTAPAEAARLAAAQAARVARVVAVRVGAEAAVLSVLWRVPLVPGTRGPAGRESCRGGPT